MINLIRKPDIIQPVTVITPKPEVKPEPIIVNKPEIVNYGILVIKCFEGCKLEAYKDVVGVWTIGYGQTGPEIKEGLKWTQEQAEQALIKSYKSFSDKVSKLVTAHKLILNDYQLQALTSFTYNLGEGNLAMLINKRQVPEIGEAILKYHKAGGKPLKGLLVRRTVERDLFNLTKNEFNPETLAEHYRKTINI